ncbi:hypothetical protein P7H20_25620 [Paenibacillus larvae]|nr:hypothetical protein [Paenibacillus larvae]MDT2277545.1 hypothetical protein [Paenibacillus larvae]
MSLAQMLYKETGKENWCCVCTGMIKGWEVRKMIEDCRAQETIPATAQSFIDQYLQSLSTIHKHRRFSGS